MQGITVQANFEMVFEAFGVKVRLESDRPELLELGMEIARTALVGRPKIIENRVDDIDHSFGIYRNLDGNLYFTNESKPWSPLEHERDFRRTLNTMIRVHVAEKARGWVFIHAGVVSWRGRAIVLPARSHSGKTTLVAELIRLGAEYFSDEYAVIDPAGRFHPYERDLSVRPPGSEIPIQVPPVEFGAVTGSTPVPVGMVVITKFEPGATFEPQSISMGIGIMETVPEVIPIRFNTDFALKVLNTAFSRAIIIKSLRGEAQIAAASILSYFDDNFNLAK
jgi:hypothetical protein